MTDVHLNLDLDFDGRSLDGRIREDDGTVHRFHGWLGLVDALERLRPEDSANSGAQGKTPEEEA